MPQVPNLDSFSVASQGGTNARVNAPAPKNFSGAQSQQLGDAITRAGGQAAQVFEDVQRQANQVRVDDAINQARERLQQLTYDPNEGYTNLKGNAAFQRPEGKSLADEYGGKFQTSADEIAQGLGNDAQRRAFSAATSGLRTQLDGNLLQHESNEFRDYTLSVREGTINLSNDDIAKNYNDPERVSANLLAIGAAVADQARLLGKSATWAAAQTRNMTSGAFRTAMGAALEKNDIGFVEKMLEEHGNDMLAGDVLAISGAVTKQKGYTYASQVASEVFSGVGTGGASPENLRMPVKGTVTSNYGARVPFRTDNGAMSSSNHDGVDIAAPEGSMVGAAASGRVVYAGQKKGYGNYVEVEHADGSRTFYGHLSTIDVKAGQQIAGGDDLGKVGHSGNATGPHLHWGMRDAAGKSVDPRGMRAVGGGRGVGANASLLDMVTAIRADPRLAGHPDWQQEAEQQVRSLYSAREEGVRKAEEEQTADVMRKIAANPNGFTPQMLAGVPDRDVGQVMGFVNSMKAAAKRDDNEGDPIVWAALKSKIASGEITSADQILQYAPKLSRTDFRDLTNDVTSIKAGDQKKIDSYTTVDRVLKFVHGEMAEAGLDWTPDSKDADTARQFGKFQSQLLKQIGHLEQVQGKPLTIEEGRAVALKLLTDVPKAGGWIGKSTQKAYELGSPVLPLNAVPQGAINQAKGALRSGGYPVTERNVRRVLAGGDPLRGG